jgi:hypothetical protein
MKVYAVRGILQTMPHRGCRPCQMPVSVVARAALSIPSVAISRRRTDLTDDSLMLGFTAP